MRRNGQWEGMAGGDSGVMGVGGKWVREEQGGRGHGNTVGAGGVVGNWGWEQGVGSGDRAGGVGGWVA